MIYSEVCQNVCIEDSCIIYVPYANRYKKEDLASCLAQPQDEDTSLEQSEEPTEKNRFVVILIFTETSSVFCLLLYKNQLSNRLFPLLYLPTTFFQKRRYIHANIFFKYRSHKNSSRWKKIIV